MRGNSRSGGRQAAALLAIGTLAMLAGAPLAAESGTACPAGALDAADAAVREVFGQDADATFSSVACSMAPGAQRADLAVAEPGSRTAGPVRFVLYTHETAGRVRVGRLTATVEVAAPHVRAAVSLDAGGDLTAADLVNSTSSVGRVSFAPLPQLAEVAGARLRRPLSAGAVIATSTIGRVALVRSGTDVVTVARVDGVEVRGRAVAAQDGHRGDLVIVVNPDSRKRLRGRVLGDALVEVLHVS